MSSTELALDRAYKTRGSRRAFRPDDIADSFLVTRGRRTFIRAHVHARTGAH